jgi:hypothetical protein
MDLKGDLSRVQLPIDDNDVACCITGWPVGDKKVYIGVAPQQGGQVIEYDIATGKTTLTGGYNALGPEDSVYFAFQTKSYFGDCYLLARLSAQRRAAEKAPTTAPAGE